MFWRVSILFLIIAMILAGLSQTFLTEVLLLFIAIMLLIIAHYIKLITNNIFIKDKEHQTTVKKVISVIALIIAGGAFFCYDWKDGLTQRIFASVTIFTVIEFILFFMYPFVVGDKMNDELELKDTILLKEIYKELCKLNATTTHNAINQETQESKQNVIKIEE